MQAVGLWKVSKFAFLYQIKTKKCIKCWNLLPLLNSTAQMLPVDFCNTQQQAPQAVSGVITSLGKRTSMGPPATTSVGACDGLWCDQQKKNRKSLSNFPNLKPNHTELSQQKTWYLPLAASSEEPAYRIAFTCSDPACHSPCTLLGNQISCICLTLTLCLPLTFKSGTSPLFFPCLLGWQLLLLEFYSTRQMTLQSWYLSGWQRPYIWAPTTDLLLLLVNYWSRSSVRCRFCTVGKAAGCGSRHSWASRGWHAAVNTFALR